MTDELTLSALIASRICHDLISPIGTINNGLELLAMTNGVAGGEEISLISTSAASAADSLRFMRIAFGAASETEMIGAREVASITAAHIGTKRLSVAWGADQRDLSRTTAKLILLMALTTASAAPLGGAMTIEDDRDGGFPFAIAISGQKVALSAQAASALKGAADLEEIEPRYAAFALLALAAKSASYKIDWRASDQAGRLTLR